MFHSYSVYRPVAQLTSIIGLAIAASGCGSDEEVTPEVELLDRTTQALSVSALEWVNGSYGAGCVSRSGAWSARISGTDTMTNSALSVVLNNTACVLTLTELVGDVTYVPVALPAGTAAPMTLDGSYDATASNFVLSSATSTLVFYANARLEPADYSSNFTIAIPFSDDPAAASGSTSASYATVTSTGSAAEIPAPDYTVGFGSFVLRADAAQLVTTSSGTVSLTAGSQAGEFYVITATSPGGTFASIDAAYTAGTATAVGATIPAASFSLAGAELPETRYVIILHADSGVKAYQVVTITFAVATTD